MKRTSDSKPLLVAKPDQCITVRYGSPKIGKDRLEEDFGKVAYSAGTARALLVADALDHLHMTVAPFLQALVKINEQFAELGQRRVGAVHLDEDLLHFRIGRERLRGVSGKAICWNRQVVSVEAIQESVPKSGIGEPGL